MPRYPQKATELTPKGEIYIEQVPFNITTISPVVVVSVNTREFSLRTKVPLHFDTRKNRVWGIPRNIIFSGDFIDSEEWDNITVY
jgi:hypothetical protein